MVELGPEACGQKTRRLRQPMKWTGLLSRNIQVEVLSRKHPNPRPEELVSVLLTFLDLTLTNSRIPQVPPSHYERRRPFRRQRSFSRESIQKLDGCECALGNTTRQTRKSRAVYRHRFRDRKVRSHGQAGHPFRL
jgi:hypothetical protein